jgi:hypothetical protein
MFLLFFYIKFLINFYEHKIIEGKKDGNKIVRTTFSVNFHLVNLYNLIFFLFVEGR